MISPGPVRIRFQRPTFSRGPSAWSFSSEVFLRPILTLAGTQLWVSRRTRRIPCRTPWSHRTAPPHCSSFAQVASSTRTATVFRNTSTDWEAVRPRPFVYFSAYEGQGYDPDDNNYNYYNALGGYVGDPDDVPSYINSNPPPPSGIFAGFSAANAPTAFRHVPGRNDIVSSVEPNPYTSSSPIPVGTTGDVNISESQAARVRQQKFFPALLRGSRQRLRYRRPVRYQQHARQFSVRRTSRMPPPRNSDESAAMAARRSRFASASATT